MFNSQSSKLGVALVGLTCLLGFSGCGEQEGPAERAGQSVDKAVEEAQDTVKEAGEKMEKGAESLMEDTKELLDTNTEQ